MTMQQKGKVHVRPLWDGVGWGGVGSCGESWAAARWERERERDGPKQEIGSWANKVRQHMHAHDSITHVLHVPQLKVM